MIVCLLPIKNKGHSLGLPQINHNKLYLVFIDPNQSYIFLFLCKTICTPCKQEKHILFRKCII